MYAFPSYQSLSVHALARCKVPCRDESHFGPSDVPPLDPATHGAWSDPNIGIMRSLRNQEFEFLHAGRGPVL